VYNGKTLKGELSNEKNVLYLTPGLSMWEGRGGLAPPTFQVMSGKILSYDPKTIYQILTDSSLPA
jgi:hypothetical protein